MESAIKGKFIVLEGIDLCGKDTQTRLLVDYLYDHPDDQKLKLLTVVATREPSGSKFTLDIRRIIKENRDPYTKAGELAELYVNDRKWHLNHIIEPALAAGAFVVSNRYMYSTLAFQQTQGLSFDHLLEMHKGMRVPDAVFFIDISGEESMRRKLGRTQRDEEMFEKIGFQTKLRDNYLALKQQLPEHNIHIIDGSRSVEEIQKDIRSVIDKLVRDAYPSLAKP